VWPLVRCYRLTGKQPLREFAGFCVLSSYQQTEIDWDALTLHDRQWFDRDQKALPIRWMHSYHAVHLSAAITPYARIHRNPFLNSESVVYTDTDSIVTTNTLDASDICSHTLGKLKLEYSNVPFRGLRAKRYGLKLPNGEEGIKMTGCHQKPNLA
jgi:hypothetical protein